MPQSSEHRLSHGNCSGWRIRGLSVMDRSLKSWEVSEITIMKPLFFLIALLLISCSREIIKTEVDVIPQPASVEVYEGECVVAGATFKVDDRFDEIASAAVADFEAAVEAASGTVSGSSKTAVVFKYDRRSGKEAYSISIAENRITVKASSSNGVLYAIQTLKQMLPVEIYTGAPASDKVWALPLAKIEDSPRFAYRGLHLDVARHFFDMDEVKRYIDIMAVHKLNILHWHLTDDQGWRIEIKKYPELTRIGSIRKRTIIGHSRRSNTYDNTPYGEGCWFTQEQIREIIGYAASKGIEIIPEIDLPGHMQSALAVFPDLGCTGGPYEVWDRWGVSKDVLCAGKEGTMEFLKNVLSEVAELFPSEYVHIGGDECPKDRWENCPACQAKIAELGLKDDEEHSAEHYLQSYVMAEMETFLASKGKRIIGWDEILDGEVTPDATVMSWRGVAGGHKAAKMGHDVIMAANNYFYFDYYQAKDTAGEPLAIGGYVPVSKVYSYEPSTEDMTEEERSHIIGIQANLWTEYIKTPEGLEYMLLPRLSALSEVQWCQSGDRDYDRFLREMEKMADIYDILDYNYATHIFDGRE